MLKFLLNNSKSGLLFGLGIISMLTVLALLFSAQPEVESSGIFSHQHLAQVRQLIKHHLNRQEQQVTPARIQFNEQELNVVANYLLQRSAPGYAKIILQEDNLVANASIAVFDSGSYLNLHMQLDTPNGQLRVNHFIAGQLPLPAAIGHWLTFRVIQKFLGVDFAQLIESVKVRPGRFDLVYHPDQSLVHQVKEKLLDLGNSAALKAYADKLNALQQQPVGQQRQLGPLLQALFEYARERAGQNQVVEENAALLTVLGLWVSRQALTSNITGLTQEPREFNLKLHRRIDAARHFLISAAFAVRGDHRLAQAIGLSKELADAETGSGFSFADLAANEAGIAFGLLATQSAEKARYVQNFMTRKFADEDIIPALHDLPENMDSIAFEKRFSGIREPAYQAMLDQIEQRVSKCRIHNN